MSASMARSLSEGIKFMENQRSAAEGIALTEIEAAKKASEQITATTSEFTAAAAEIATATSELTAAAAEDMAAFYVDCTKRAIRLCDEKRRAVQSSLLHAVDTMNKVA
jgi:isoleucyl-tRNA synthetase